MCAQHNMPTPSDSLLLPLPRGEWTERGEAEGERDTALCRATLYAALALGFRPATTETLDRLANADAAAALADAALVLETRAGAAELGTCAAALAQSDVNLGHLAAAYRRLFGHTARGEVPAYETEYGSEALFQQPQELGDLAGFMRAFGLRLREDAHERIDHVSCECEFLSFLACKQAYAIDTNDQEMLEVTARATKLFLRDHLGRFASAFARRLVRADADGFYGALGRLLLTLVDADCRRFGVATGPEGLGLRPDPATCAAPMGCAAAEEDGCATLMKAE